MRNKLHYHFVVRIRGQRPRWGGNISESSLQNLETAAYVIQETVQQIFSLPFSVNQLEQPV